LCERSGEAFIFLQEYKPYSGFIVLVLVLFYVLLNGKIRKKTERKEVKKK